MGNNTPKKNRNIELAAEQTLVDGFNKHPSLIPALVINGVSQTPQQIVGTLNSRIDSAKAVVTTKATWRATIEADKALRDATKTLVSGVRESLVVAFGSQIAVLADFGLTPKAKAVLTPEQRLARAAKAKATRAARHTLGSKQKAAIKSTVTPIVTVTTAPATPPSPVTPQATPVTPVTPVATSPAAPNAAPVTPTQPAATDHVAPQAKPVIPATPVTTSPAAPQATPAAPAVTPAPLTATVAGA